MLNKIINGNNVSLPSLLRPTKDQPSSKSVVHFLFRDNCLNNPANTADGTKNKYFKMAKDIYRPKKLRRFSLVWP